MTRLICTLGAALAVLAALATTAEAQCSAPSTPGVRICTPTPNSTSVYVNGIEVNSTAKSGSITHFDIYIDGHLEFRSAQYQAGVNLYDGAIRNGRHHLVVHAWDSGGNVLSAAEYFTVTGEGYPLFCSAPSGPGINFCVPPAGSVQINGSPVSATATGYSAISSIKVYVNGVFEVGNTGQNYLSTSVPAAPGYPTITVVAKDSTGHTFKTSKQVHVAYGAYGCDPYGGSCTPGINVSGPQDEAYVGSSFTVKASVEDNPQPITTMKAYIDGTQVASSSGPTLYQKVSTTATGTHILTLQAWDTKGTLYRVQQNINISVPH